MKPFNMVSRTRMALVFLLCIGFLSGSYADVRKPAVTFSDPGLADMQNIMNVVRKVNLRQMDRNTTRTFDEFFTRKNQMNESVQMLEKATAVRQTPEPSLKPRLHPLPKAY